jgi:hypothetical protein
MIEREADQSRGERESPPAITPGGRSGQGLCFAKCREVLAAAIAAYSPNGTLWNVGRSTRMKITRA